MTTPVSAVVVVDLKDYSDIARLLEQQLGVDSVHALNRQIQLLIAEAAAKVDFSLENVPYKSTGDGAIIVLKSAELASDFAEALHNAAQNHNRDKTIATARRYFRIGIWSDPVLILKDRKPDGTVSFDFAGTAIANAVRLESACDVGGVLIGSHSWADLPKAKRLLYGPEVPVKGKRDETFPAHRRQVIVPVTAELPSPTANPRVPQQTAPAAPAEDSHAGRLLEIHKRRLQILEMQKATLGTFVPPHMELDIEDTKRIIAELESRRQS